MKVIAAGIFALLLAACTVSFSPDDSSNLPQTTSGTPQQQLEAERSAREFLAMIDRGEFDTTWDRAGPALRDQTSKLTWINMLKLTSKTLAGGSTRDLEGFGFSTQIDANVPVGEYVLVQLKDVSDRVTTTEKVVMQRDQSEWKIIGYFVTKRSEFGAGI
jgi:hypothetical protein